MSGIDWSKHRVWSAEMIVAEQKLLQGAQPATWGRAVEQEVKRRIKCSVATYAYEIEDAQIMTDGEWDKLAQSINPKLGTCHPEIDEFFAAQFSPMTGMWIHQHPELPAIAALYATRKA